MATVRRKAKFRVGQVVRLYGIPEIGEGHLFIGYRRVRKVDKRDDGFFYFDGRSNLIRESRLRPLTARERGEKARQQ